jgi:chromosomal replication initiation ATPase DnaA
VNPISIIAYVCAKHRVGRRDIVGDGRARHIVAARNEACYRLRVSVKSQMSLPEIGRLVGLHHASVLRAIRRYEHSARERAA